MENYNNEDEQVEALKRWWKENGTSTIVGAVLFLGLVLGYQGWQQHQQSTAEAASSLYQEMIKSLDDKASNRVEGVASQIVADYPSTGYADAAGLFMGGLAVEQGDYPTAEVHLRRVMEGGAAHELKLLAKLRLGRVLLHMEKATEALALLEAGEQGKFQPAFQELKGDIYLSQGSLAEARSAYSQALIGFAKVSSKSRLIQMKLDDLSQ